MNNREKILYVTLIVSIVGFLLLAYNIMFSSTTEKKHENNESNEIYSNVTPELKPLTLSDLQELVVAAEKTHKKVKCKFVTKRYNFLGIDLGVIIGEAYILDSKHFIIKIEKKPNNPYLIKLFDNGLREIYGKIDGDMLYLYFKFKNNSIYEEKVAISKDIDDFKWDNVMGYCEVTDEKIEYPKNIKENYPPIERIIFS